MTDELLDLVDKDDNVIGTVWKSEAHANPAIIHREVRAIIFDKKGRVLLQQRSYSKKNGPGLWVESAAGHVGVHENPEDAAVREIKEELGFNAKLLFFKKYFHTHTRANENSESRFTYVYYSLLNSHPKLNLQESEVNTAEWVKINEFVEFSKKKNYELTSTSHKLILEIIEKIKIT